MSDIAIRCEGLSKQYRIGKRERYKALRDVLTDGLSAPFRALGSAFRNGHKSPISNLESNVTTDHRPLTTDSFWALDDVSFEVNHGEVVGIIGRNGAGKSTLLKILSRITEPTRGFAEINGRVGSLLEVGTGFHPELTGRENIYLSGAILGMKKAEIGRRFDEIVAFAETEKFLDTPVKYYSSGMQMRLAFAVAAHLDPEILLVDEVLAVGDAQFQKKCLGKMGEVAKAGRTVLLVSHNMAAINRLCNSVMWIKEGCLSIYGPSESVVSCYLSERSLNTGEYKCNDDVARGNEKIRLCGVRVLNREEKTSSTLDIRHPFYVEIHYQVLGIMPSIRVLFSLCAGDGTIVFTSSDTNDAQWVNKTRQPGLYISRCEVPGNFLNSGRYTLSVASDIPLLEILFFEENILSIQVERTDGFNGRLAGQDAGLICPSLPWSIEFEESHSAP